MSLLIYLFDNVEGLKKKHIYPKKFEENNQEWI